MSEIVFECDDFSIDQRRVAGQPHEIQNACQGIILRSVCFEVSMYKY